MYLSILYVHLHKISMLISLFQGSILGPDEFVQGLGIGLKSFVGGTVGEFPIAILIITS